MWDGKLKVTPEDRRKLLTEQENRTAKAREELRQAKEDGTPQKIAAARRWLEIQELSLKTIKEHMPKGTEPSSPTRRG